MAMWHKHSQPINRSMRELDRQIAAVQKEIRHLTLDSAHISAAEPSKSKTVANFMKDMLATPRKSAAPTYRPRNDLFDVGNEPLKDLEADPVAFARKPEAELFTARASSSTVTPAMTDTSAQEKLAHYLSAGSIRTYPQLKHVQRRQRNRFFMWIGLSCAALWLIYVVVR